jgi:hypothetical protein
MGACESTPKRTNNYATGYNNVPVPGNNVAVVNKPVVATTNYVANNYKPYNFQSGEKYFLIHREQEAFKGQVVGGKARVQINLGLKFTNSTYSTNPQAFKVNVGISMLSNKYSLQDLGSTLPLGVGKLTFETSYKVDYLFEEHQKLKFDVCYNNAPSDTVETTIGRIFGSVSKSVEFPLDKLQGVILVASVNAVKEETECTSIDFSFEPKIQGYATNNYFVVVSAYNMNAWQNVYKSKEQRLPKIITSSIRLNDINNGDLDKQIQVEIYEENKGLVGKIVASMNQLAQSNGVVNLDTNIQCLIGFQTQKEMKFVEYIQSGLQISVMCAIDFTASNGDPSTPTSLHHLGGMEPNHYEQALRACCSIISYYDYDQKFPVFGFGGNINGMTNHCFPCNLLQDPNVDGVEGIVASYKHSISHVRLDGPTYFSPVIKAMTNSVKESLQQKINSYYIFMILTDGDIHDMNETKDALYEASFLPISFIIVGIGNCGFDAMVALDGDEVQLTNTKGQKVERDIVQFVKYNNYKVDVNKLAQELLKEIPGQVERYFKLHKNFKGNQTS